MENNVKKTFRECVLENLYFWILTSIALILLIVSFFLPPAGEINPGTLQGVAEIFAFASLGTVIKAIDNGKSVEMKHGDTTITVRKKKEEEIEEENIPEED